MWEDERNKLGGRWLVNLDKRKRGAELDRFWLETVSEGIVELCAKIFANYVRRF